MKILLAILLVFTFSLLNAQEVRQSGPSIDFTNGPLRVSENKRFLEHENGTPFFYLGDTSWELFHRLNREDAERYLENRREKGFTVIQAVALAELDGLNDPNPYGERPLIENDLSRPNEKYWKHIDWIIKKAEEKGLYIGLLPTWGDKVDLQSWGKGPLVFNPENAYAYGKWIGNRYKDFKNIIWINGGDRDGGGSNTAIWNALARGIKSSVPDHLMTFHPWGGHSSSEWFHNEDWLDFNMMQTGHGERSYFAYKKLLERDYQSHPVKPTFDGEPRYEDHPVNWNPDILGWFDDSDIRQALYWSLFTGGFGFTYGCHPVWQMKTPDKEPIGLVRNNWYDVLDLPGAWDLIHGRNLVLSRPFFDRRPAQEIVLNPLQSDNDQIVATRGDNYAMVYIPTGLSAYLDLQNLDFETTKIWWYNPRNGEYTFVEETAAKGIKDFSTPSKGRGNDWILVLDNAEMDFSPPGSLK
ncbi:MAG: glycoside hydrolase family 140 protein [Bacteroidales bacterium]|nr:glycoside hydrolase family 140 protein [Bacteroidales bacterium]